MSAAYRLYGKSEAMRERTAAEQFLICIECGRVSDDGRGWKAEWADPDDDPHELAVYCAYCWAREFDDE